MRHPRLAALAFLIPLVAGCEGEKRYLPPKTASGLPATEPAPAPEPAPTPPTPPRPVIGQTTTEIKNAPAEVGPGGAQVSSGKITAKDPITIQGNAYVSIVGQASIGQIKRSLDLFYTQNERYPADLAEFMEAIIKPNGIRLPQLPSYQEYGYDPNGHQLIVLEYPDRKPY